jgi:hypothetical protein
MRQEERTAVKIDLKPTLQLLEEAAPRARALLLQHGLPLPDPRPPLAARRLARRLTRLEQVLATQEKQLNTRKADDDEANASG